MDTVTYTVYFVVDIITLADVHGNEHFIIHGNSQILVLVIVKFGTLYLVLPGCECSGDPS